MNYFNAAGFVSATDWKTLVPKLRLAQNPTNNTEFVRLVWKPLEVPTDDEVCDCRADQLPVEWTGEFPVRTDDIIMERVLWCLNQFHRAWTESCLLPADQHVEAVRLLRIAYASIDENLAVPWPRRTDNMAHLLTAVKQKTPWRKLTKTFKLHWLMLPTTAAFMKLLINVELVWHMACQMEAKYKIVSATKYQLHTLLEEALVLQQAYQILPAAQETALRQRSAVLLTDAYMTLGRGLFLENSPSIEQPDVEMATAVTLLTEAVKVGKTARHPKLVEITAAREEAARRWWLDYTCRGGLDVPKHAKDILTQNTQAYAKPLASYLE